MEVLLITGIITARELYKSIPHSTAATTGSVHRGHGRIAPTNATRNAAVYSLRPDTRFNTYNNQYSGSAMLCVLL